eukprot:7032104-Ditylum_brightwellii.AAC.1
MIVVPPPGSTPVANSRHGSTKRMSWGSAHRTVRVVHGPVPVLSQAAAPPRSSADPSFGGG